MSRDLTFLQRMAAAIVAAPGEDIEPAWARIEAAGAAEVWLEKARQVLRAMDVPSEAMIEAHFEAHARAATIFADVREMWRAMLRAAIRTDRAPARRRPGETVFMADVGGVQR